MTVSFVFFNKSVPKEEPFEPFIMSWYFNPCCVLSDIVGTREDMLSVVPSHVRVIIMSHQQFLFLETSHSQRYQ